MKTLLAIALTIIMLVMLYSELRQEGYFRHANSYRQPDAAFSVPVNPMLELDFLSRKEVLKIREQAVTAVPQLLGGPYEPSLEVFGQIEDGKAWWGIEGIYYYGPGQQSIAGMSEESRFLANPFLPVGLCEPHCYVVKETSAPNQPFPPRLVDLTWHPDRRVTATYDVQPFLQALRRLRAPGAETPRLVLVAYNARDFGYSWLAIDTSASSRVRWHGTPDKPAQIRQFLHCGHSCGYPGGGNNMSPYQPELEFSFAEPPARAVIRLWRGQPTAVTDLPDLEVTIDMR